MQRTALRVAADAERQAGDPSQLADVGAKKVRELIRPLEKDGWHQVRQRGSHRQFQHPTKLGTVTVSGKLGVDIPPGTLRPAECPETGGSRVKSR
jgi:predicted RNA binding protein YcfA (HicA-like mRNA interferase family)